MEKINDILDRRNVVTEIDNSDDGNGTKKKKRGPSIIIFIFSLISAFGFWVYVLGYDSVVEERKFKMIEIEIRGEAELYKNSHFTLVKTESVTTDLIIRGKRSLLGNLRTEDVKAYINVDDVDKEGNDSREVLFELPNGLSVKSSSVSVYSFKVIKSSESKPFNVTCRIDQAIADSSCSLGEVSCFPQTIRITGAETVISQIKDVVLSLDLGYMEVSKKATVSSNMLLVLDDEGNKIDASELKFSCSSFDIYAELLKIKEIPITIKTKGTIDEKYLDISYSPQSVKIQGEISSLETVNSFEVSIDESRIKDEPVTYFKSFVFPDFVTFDSQDSGVTINVALKDLVGKSIVIKQEDITYLDIPDGFWCVLNDTEKQLDFKGTAEDIKDLSKEDFMCRVVFPDQTYEAGKQYDCILEIILKENEKKVFLIGDHSVNVTMHKVSETNDQE